MATYLPVSGNRLSGPPLVVLLAAALALPGCQWSSRYPFLAPIGVAVQAVPAPTAVATPGPAPVTPLANPARVIGRASSFGQPLVNAKTEIRYLGRRQVVGYTTTDATGQFSLLIDKPLPPGTLLQALVTRTSNVVGNDGAGIIAAGGGNVVGNDGAGLVAAGGGNIIAAGGGNIIAAGGGNLAEARRLSGIGQATGLLAPYKVLADEPPIQANLVITEDTTLATALLFDRLVSVASAYEAPGNDEPDAARVDAALATYQTLRTSSAAELARVNEEGGFIEAIFLPDATPQFITNLRERFPDLARTVDELEEDRSPDDPLVPDSVIVTVLPPTPEVDEGASIQVKIEDALEGAYVTNPLTYLLAAVRHRWLGLDVHEYRVKLTGDGAEPETVVCSQQGATPDRDATFTSVDRKFKYTLSLEAWGDIGGTTPTTHLNAVRTTTLRLNDPVGSLPPAIQATLKVRLDDTAFNGLLVLPITTPAEGTFTNPTGRPGSSAR